MYPNLLLPLLILSGALIAGLIVAAIRQPVSRRLALRQLSRRRREAALAIVGSTLATAIIAGALTVGDTLNFSVKQTAYQTLGPIDERVVSPDASTGQRVWATLASFRSNPAVDGLLSADVSDGAATIDQANSPYTAEPRLLIWGVDFPWASGFGATNGSSGISGATPGTDDVVINQPLAESLDAHVGQQVRIFMFGQPHTLLLTRILPETGLAGMGLGGTTNRNAFVSPALLRTAAAEARAPLRNVILVSNTGGVETGNQYTATVTAQLRRLIADERGVLVDTPKHDVLKAAKVTGDSLGALFLMIGSFSIIAAALLLVNIFVMFADERTPQLGTLRAVGMKRGQLVGSLTMEGSAYAVASVLPGVALGLGVGWVVAQVAAQIFRSFSASGQGLSIKFAVTGTSLVNAAALGLVIGVLTILVTSVRISRLNVIAAIRDLPNTPRPRVRRLLTAVATTLAFLLAVAAVPSVASSDAVGTYLLPSLALLLLVPLLRGALGSRRAVTLVAAAILVWSLAAPLVRPRMYDSASMAVFVISGVLVAFSGVALVSQNQDVVLGPIRKLFERPGQTGLAVRLAVAYPLAKRFRTGATLVMYTLITLVIVLLVEVAAVINGSITQNVRDATAGYAMRLDFSAQSSATVLRSLREGGIDRSITEVTPLVSARALALDPGHRTTEPLEASLVGVPDGAVNSMAFNRRLAGYPTDAAIWQLVAANPRYVVMDSFFGSTGGPNGSYYGPGDRFTIIDPRSGNRETKIIAGILANSMMFYPASGDAAGRGFPVIASADAIRQEFGPEATISSAFLRLRPGTDPEALRRELQARYLPDSLVATPMAAAVRRMFAANIAFFRLMQGFLALGLAIGITGLGVVMVRAVRERRRTIGVLRALGFRSGTVERSFLIESGLVASEGVLLGSVLGVLTTWLMYQKSAMFEGVRSGFPVAWLTILVLAAVTVVASLLATFLPARRAARIRPALAVRIAD
jgi:putative ABC transport system permease protein